jgi:hypothetical protein
LPANPTEPETYTIDDTIRVPVALRDEEGVGQWRFRRLWAKRPRRGRLRARRLTAWVRWYVRNSW